MVSCMMQVGCSHQSPPLHIHRHFSNQHTIHGYGPPLWDIFSVELMLGFYGLKDLKRLSLKRNHLPGFKVTQCNNHVILRMYLQNYILHAQIFQIPESRIYLVKSNYELRKRCHITPPKYNTNNVEETIQKM